MRASDMIHLLSCLQPSRPAPNYLFSRGCYRIWLWEMWVLHLLFGITDSLSYAHDNEMKTSGEKKTKRLSSWREKYLSTSGRLVLINYVITLMILYMWSFFLVRKGVFKDWTNIFLVLSAKRSRSYHLAKTECPVLNKWSGGLDISNLEAKMHCLSQKIYSCSFLLSTPRCGRICWAISVLVPNAYQATPIFGPV